MNKKKCKNELTVIHTSELIFQAMNNATKSRSDGFERIMKKKHRSLFYRLKSGKVPLSEIKGGVIGLCEEYLGMDGKLFKTENSDPKNGNIIFENDLLKSVGLTKRT